MLPPPIATDKPIKLDTVVRPVIMAARLENEALEPVRIDIVVRQVVDSSERSARTPGGERESIEINRKTVVPYRIRSTSASSAVLPYPFCAPAQSALAIVSYREVEKWEEQQAINRAFNIEVDNKFKKDQKTYQSKRTEYAPKAEEYGVKSLNNQLLKEDYDRRQQEYTARRQAWEAAPLDGRGAAPVKPAKPRYENNPKPKKPNEPKRGKYKGLTPKPNGDDANKASFIIGNNAHSAPWCLAEMFDTLILVCDALRSGDKDNELGTQGAGLRRLLDAMRGLLNASGSRTEQTLLEALLSAKPSPIVAAVTESNDLKEFVRQFEVTETVAETDDGLPQYDVIAYDPENEESKKRRDKRMSKLQDELKDAAKKIREQTSDENASKNTYQFVYERMPLEARSGTTMLLQYQFEVNEHNQERPTIFRFEAEQYFGIVAHSIYAGYHNDVDRLDNVAKEFVRCMFDLKHNRTPTAKATDAAEYAKQLLGDMVAYFPSSLKLGVLPEGNDETPLQWLYKKTGGRVAKWLNKKTQSFDPGKIETISNELRVMSRLILPVWPPLRKGEPPRNRSSASARENAEVERAMEAASEYVPEDDDDVPEFFDLEAPRPDRPASPSTAADEGIVVVGEEDEDSDNEPPPLAAAASGGTNVAGVAKVTDLQVYRLSDDDDGDPMRIVRRDLPQIVLPSHTSLPTFVTPNDTTLPDEHQKQPPQRSWFLPVLFITAAGIWFAFWSGLTYFYWYLTLMPLLVKKYSGQILGILRNARQGGQRVVDALYELTIGNVWGAVVGVLGLTGKSIKDRIETIEVPELEWIIGVNLAWLQSNIDSVAPAYVVATRAWEFGRWLNQPNNVRGNIYWRSIQKARGTPIISALGAARGAIVGMREKDRIKQGALRTLEGSRVVFNALTMKRFTFYERYVLNDLDDPLRLGDEGVVALHGDDEWARIPDATSLTLLPPVDVSEALYEAEILRDIPIARAVARSVGSAPDLTATTPAQIDANAAHRELMQVIKGARTPLLGAHIMHSSGSTALQLATEGAALLRSAYGVRAGVTLVPGDDPVWTCLPAGVAARIAIRHSSVFESADQLRRDNRLLSASEQYVAQLKKWCKPQRAMVDAFADAWVHEAREELRGEGDYSIGLMGTALHATRSFARTKLLARDELKSVVGLIVASANSVLLASLRTEQGSGQLAGIIASERAAAETFSEQRTYKLPNRVSNPQMVKPAWASRRLDLDWAREMHLARKATSVRDIVRQLASLDVDDEDDDPTTRIYYCPMGSTLDALPGKVPFAIDQLGSRPVWLELLAANAQHVSRVLASAVSFQRTATPAVTISARLLSVLGGPDELPGLARHPLAVYAKGRDVKVALSRTPNAGDISALPAAKKDLVEALLALADGVLTEAIQKHVARLRSVAFNTDRLLNAVALATQTTGTVSTTIVHLPTPEAALALALALTLYKAESGASPPGLSVLVEDVDTAQQLLSNAQEVAVRGMSAGCKACPLAEVAAVLV